MFWICASIVFLDVGFDVLHSGFDVLHSGFDVLDLGFHVLGQHRL